MLGNIFLGLYASPATLTTLAIELLGGTAGAALAVIGGGRIGVTLEKREREKISARARAQNVLASAEEYILEVSAVRSLEPLPQAGALRVDPARLLDLESAIDVAGRYERFTTGIKRIASPSWLTSFSFALAGPEEYREEFKALRDEKRYLTS